MEVACHDGEQWSAYNLDRPSVALHVPPGIWAEETYKTEDALLTVLTSHPYEPSDYVSDFEEFLALKAVELSGGQGRKAAPMPPPGYQ